MKSYTFEKNINLLLAAFIILALFFGKSIFLGYLSFIFLVFSVITSVHINIRGYFLSQEDMAGKNKEEIINLELFNPEEKEVQEAANKSYKTLVCRA